jgi:hypothetical protein
MRIRFRNRTRDRGGEPIRLAFCRGCHAGLSGAAWDALPKKSGYEIKMEKDYLILKRASASRPSGEWKDDDYDVLADG